MAINDLAYWQKSLESAQKKGSQTLSDYAQQNINKLSQAVAHTQAIPPGTLQSQATSQGLNVNNYQGYTPLEMSYVPSAPKPNPTPAPMPTSLPIQQAPPQSTPPQSTPPQSTPPQATPTNNGNNDLMAQITSLMQQLQSSQPQQPAIQQYKSPYDTQIGDMLSKIMNYKKEAFDPNNNAGLKVAQQQAMLQADTNMNRRGMLNSQSGKYGQDSAYQAGQNLIPQYQQIFDQQQQQGFNNLGTQLNSIQGVDNTGYGRFRDTVGDKNTNYTNANNNYWKSLESATGLSNTAYDRNISEQDRAIAAQDRAIMAQDKTKQDYIESITGLGEQFDYKSEMNALQNDVDPSNDWKVPFLMQQREKKQQTRMANAEQYSADYQAEINKRMALDPNDPLIPMLSALRAQKIATQEASALDANEKRIKSAFDLWKQMPATDEISAILGVPVGAESSDYLVDMANINQSNAAAEKSRSSDNKLTATESKNQIFSQDYYKYHNMSVDGAKQAMKNDKAELISKFGYNGFDNMWDTVLDEAIKMGQALPASGKAPKASDPVDDYIKQAMEDVFKQK